MGPIFVREVPADVAVWPGRRLLAVLDAVAWPALWIYATLHAPFDTGLAGKAVVAVATVMAVHRVIKALLRSERYRFSARRWGRVALGLLLLGFVLKVAVGLS
jgi:hypothetical protein